MGNCLLWQGLSLILLVYLKASCMLNLVELL